MVTSEIFRHTEAGGWPSTKSKNGGLLERDFFQLGCVSLDNPRKMSIQRENAKWSSNHTVKSSSPRPRCFVREKKGPSQGIIPKVRTSGAKSMGFQIRGQHVRRNPKTGAVRPQRRLETGKGCL